MTCLNIPTKLFDTNPPDKFTINVLEDVQEIRFDYPHDLTIIVIVDNSQKCDFKLQVPRIAYTRDVVSPRLFENLFSKIVRVAYGIVWLKPRNDIFFDQLAKVIQLILRDYVVIYRPENIDVPYIKMSGISVKDDFVNFPDETPHRTVIYDAFGALIKLEFNNSLCPLIYAVCPNLDLEQSSDLYKSIKRRKPTDKWSYVSFDIFKWSNSTYTENIVNLAEIINKANLNQQ